MKTVLMATLSINFDNLLNMLLVFGLRMVTVYGMYGLRTFLYI